MLYISHIVSSLDKEGMACVLASNGILFREGAEAKMREQLLKDNEIDCMIQLPGKMLTSTAIATTLMILKKNRKRSDILFIDLSGEVDKISKLTTQLSEQTINRAVSLYQGFENSEISRTISVEEIIKGGCNLSVKRYMVKAESQQIDIAAVNETIDQLEKKLQNIQSQIRKLL